MSVLIYTNKNGVRVELRSGQDLETMWATQEQISQIFERDVGTISRHISNIFNEGELDEKSNLQKMQIANSDKPVGFYSLNVIIAVGYRTNSAIATQFRIWATKILNEYIVKGFTMDDERLKDPARNQYFRELLERVKEIRASEKLFYQQVRDIYATAIDYEEKKNDENVILFFKKVQNKLIYAITEKTAAELIIARHDQNDINFGCTNWKGSIVRKGDIDISKNYLTKKELQLLTSLVNQLLDHLEDQILREKPMKLADWEVYTDKLIQFREYKILPNAGSVSHENMQKIVLQDYDIFDNNRKQKQKEEAEKEAIKDLKEIEKEVKEILKGKKLKNKAEIEAPTEFTEPIDKIINKSK